VQWAGQRTALGVDKLLGTVDVLIKPLPVAAGLQAVLLGAAFAMVVRGALVLKLPEDRVATLLADGSGSPFGKNPGQSYREWVALPHGEPVTDLPLAREALEFARSARR